jgi:hypothetical protein
MRTLFTAEHLAAPMASFVHSCPAKTDRNNPWHCCSRKGGLHFFFYISNIYIYTRGYCYSASLYVEH